MKQKKCFLYVLKGGVLVEKVRVLVDTLRDTFPQFKTANIVKDLEGCVEDFGVKVFYSDMKSFEQPDKISGYSIVNDKGKPEIIVNGEHSEGRRRFTIAHELGHIIMHWGWLNEPGQKLDKNLQGILFRKDVYTKDESVKERQANEFAAEMLAPLDVIKEELVGWENMSALERIVLTNKISQNFKISTRFAEVQIDKALKGS